MIGRERGIGSGGSFYWFFQRITGIVLVFALLMHFWVLHFFAPFHGEITYDSVMMRLSHPLWRAADLIFLVVGLWHGMYGVMLNIHDYVRKPALSVTLVAVLWVVIIFYMVIGSMTILGLA